MRKNKTADRFSEDVAEKHVKLANQLDMLEKWLKKHSNPRPVVWDEDGPVYDERGGLVWDDMEIGELEPVAAPRISIDTTNSLFMWHPSGQLIQCGQWAYVWTNPVLYMFAFYGIIGNRA